MLQLTSNYFSQLLDYEEDGEFHLMSATAAFIKRDLKRIADFCEVVVPSFIRNRWVQIVLSNDQNQLRSSCTVENRTLSSSHVDSSHVTQIKNGVWPGTGFEWQMVSTFSVRKFRLGILDYLSRCSVYFGKFPFGQTKTVLPFTSQPKFPEFFGKW